MPATLEHEPIATDEDAAVVAVVAAAATPDASHARGTKSYTASVELKATAEGTFRATIATFNAVDLHGDVTVPGAFQAGQRVKIAAFGHNWGSLPVGAGTIGQDEKRAWVDGSFFLDTTHGLDTYRTVKALGADQEWSYGFEVMEAEYGQFEGQDVRFLKGLKAFEACPVMVGAGINTRTDFIKGHERYSDQTARVLGDLDEWISRTKSLADTLRADVKEGREISTARRQRLASNRDALREQIAAQAIAVADDLDGLLQETEPRPKQAETPEPPRVVGGMDLDALKARFHQLDTLYGVSPGSTTHAITG